MKRKNREKTNTSAKIFSGMFFLAGLAVLVLIGISLGKEVYRKRQIQKEIEGLQSQISQMGQQNGDMENLISYLSSTDFQEKQAREKLNLQKSDEKMIVLRKDVVQPDSQPQNTPINPQAPPEDNSPNWQKWWKYFFAAKS
ncbi:MAG TPA: septum formation initiator family protein [Candidatus Saccharimonadales bacterium]|nr:septum formation initiator family protein [Candidatus Saccharimonadales bacterium]